MTSRSPANRGESVGIAVLLILVTAIVVGSARECYLERTVPGYCDQTNAFGFEQCDWSDTLATPCETVAAVGVFVAVAVVVGATYAVVQARRRSG